MTSLKKIIILIRIVKDLMVTVINHFGFFAEARMYS